MAKSDDLMAKIPARWLIDDLMRLLRAQTEALVQGDSERAVASSERIAGLLEQVGPTVAVLSAAERKPIDDLLREAQRLNDRNAEILATRMAANRARTDVLLQSAAGVAPVYGATGQTQAVVGPGARSVTA
jgi:flagellar biosynthesis/type III secretory pathway chaperone